MSAIVLLDATPDTMTVGWARPGVPRELEIRANNQETPTKVSLSAGTVRKKNLKEGDEVAFRVSDPERGWSQWHVFRHDGGAAHPPAPRVSLDRAEDGVTAVARIEFEPIDGCSKYEVALFGLDGVAEDWTSISDSLPATLVRKKNLRPDVWYSFKYRGFSSSWGPWSAASVPEACPESNLILSRALAPKLMRVDGSYTDVGALTGKVIALYFSASWCPPCRQYTPKLVEFYQQMRAAGKPFEVVFVSCDHDEGSFRQYFGKMGWLAVPFNDSRREELQMEHQIRGIPALRIISGRSGKLVEADAIRLPLTPSTLDTWVARV